MFKEGYRNESQFSASYYERLGVLPTATQEEIAQAFKKLSKEHHPDVGGDLGTYQNLSEAYATLKDADKRKLYDEKTRATTESTKAPPTYEPPRSTAPKNGEEPARSTQARGMTEQEDLERRMKEMEDLFPKNPLDGYHYGKPGGWEEHLEENKRG
jgi:curved DNA-binding protein CbpA